MSPLTPTIAGSPHRAADVEQYRTLFGGGFIHDAKNYYGADTTGITDSTAIVQAAANAAIAVGGKLVLPAGIYKVSDTIDLANAGGAAQFNLGILGDSYRTIISWAGPPNTPVFRSYGWKQSAIQGVLVRANGIAGVVGWDIDSDTTRQSSSDLSWKDCMVEMGTGGNCVGWRGGNGMTGAGDISFLTFENCKVNSSGYTYGDIGWQALRNNALDWTWIGGSGVSIKHIFSNARPGGGEVGGGSMSFLGMGSSGNDVDFNFVNGAAYLIAGGRYEAGRRFLTSGALGSTVGLVVEMVGVEVGQYDPTDGIVFALNAASQLVVDGCNIHNNPGQPDFTSAMFTLNIVDNHAQSLSVRGGVIQAADPFYTVVGSTGVAKVTVDSVAKQNTADLAALTFFKNRNRPIPGSTTWDPPSVAAGAQTTTTVAVTGAAVGDPVMVGFDKDLQGMQLSGYVSAVGTVTVVLRNGTAGAIDLASGTLRASVVPQ